MLVDGVSLDTCVGFFCQINDQPNTCDNRNLLYGLRLKYIKSIRYLFYGLERILLYHVNDSRSPTLNDGLSKF